MDGIKTLQQAIIHFSTFENCKAEMVQLRWPDGVVELFECGSAHVTYWRMPAFEMLPARPFPKFSLKTGTIFEDSPLGLDKWLAALWLVVNCKNGVSSCEVARDLGVTQKTAWFMNHRLRFALNGGGLGKLSGEVEADETFIGGKARNMHAAKRAAKITGTGGKDKTAVMGILERGGKVRTSVVPNRKKRALQSRSPRTRGSRVRPVHRCAPESYSGLDEFQHQVVDHAVEYVDGKIHTNGLENFWSLLKRGLNGTYISVEPFHLFRYLDEQTFRYNNREEMNDSYKHLTGKDRAPDTAVFI